MKIIETGYICTEILSRLPFPVCNSSTAKPWMDLIRPVKNVNMQMTRQTSSDGRIINWEEESDRKSIGEREIERERER